MKHILLYLFMSVALYSFTIEDNFKNKPKLTSEELESKKDGSYFTGLPLMNFDPNTGLGYGLGINWINDKTPDDPLFKYTPYRAKVYLVLFTSTKGYQFHTINFDFPYINNSLFRLTGNLSYEKNIQANYFGVDASSLNNLTTPNGEVFRNYDDYKDNLTKNGSELYNNFFLEKISAEFNLGYDLFSGVGRATIGTNFSHFNIKSYENLKIGDIQNNENLLFDQKDQISGYQGGYNNGIKLGLIFDSRDFRPNPKSGSAQDISLEFFTRFLGSEYEYQRYTFSTKNFYTPSSMDYMTIALRGVYSAQFGDIPFFAMNTIGYSEELQYGLGGTRTLRGFKQDRFVGPVKVLGNLEARFTLNTQEIYGETFDFMLVPLLDAGKVFNSVEDTDLINYKIDYGLGLRIIWDLASVIMIDYAISEEGKEFYINFNHSF